MVERSHKEYRRLLAELTAAVASRTRQAAADSIALRDAVCAYVAVEHARGARLEEIVETVTEILVKAENEWGHSDSELAQQLVDWCHEFHPDGAGSETPDLKLVT